MRNIEMLSAALGLLGAILLATKSRYAGLAFVAWLVSNLGWLIFGAHNAHWFFFAQQIGFTFTSALGVWNWLIHPALKGEQDAQAYHAARDERAKKAIHMALEGDFAALVHGALVLHTSAPITYDCLRGVYIMAEEEGRAQERESAGGLP